jgi:hypothetical protein
MPALSDSLVTWPFGGTWPSVCYCRKASEIRFAFQAAAIIHRSSVFGWECASVCVPWCRSQCSGVKGQPDSDIHTIHRQMEGHYGQAHGFVLPEPVMKYWWKNINILPAAQWCSSKRVNECEDLPSSCYPKTKPYQDLHWPVGSPGPLRTYD